MCLGGIGQSLIAIAGLVNACQKLHILGHGQAVGIRQCLDHVGGSLGCFPVHNGIGLGEHTCDQPLTGDRCIFREQTEQIPVDLGILGQFDQIPARIQHTLAHIVPSGICIQVHGLCSFLGIENVEVQVLICGNILIDLEARSVISGTCTGNVQSVNRAISVIPLDLHGAKAFAIRSADGHLVGIGIHSSLVAFDCLHAGIQLALQILGNSGLAILAQCFVSFISFPNVSHILDTLGHPYLTCIGQSLDQCGNLICGILVHQIVGSGIQAGNLPGANHIGILGEQAEDEVIYRHIGGDFNFIPARFQCTHFKVLPGTVCIQLHGLCRGLGIVDVEEHIAAAAEILEEAEAGNIIGVGLIRKGQAPNRAVQLILLSGHIANGRAVGRAKLQILLGGIKYGLVAVDLLIAGKQIFHLLLGQIHFVRLGSLVVQCHCIFNERQVLDIPLHFEISRLGQLIQLSRQISAVGVHSTHINSASGLNSSALLVDGVNDDIATVEQFFTLDLHGSPSFGLYHKTLVPVEVEDLAIGIIIVIEADFHVVVTLGIQRRAVGEIAFLGGAVKGNLDATLIVTKLHVRLILHGVICTADLAYTIEFVECQELTLQTILLSSIRYVHIVFQSGVQLIVIGNDIAVHIRQLCIVHIQSFQHFAILDSQILGQLVDLVNDAKQLGLPLVIFFGVFRTHGNGPLVEVEYGTLLRFHTETEAQNLLCVKLTSQCTEPELQIVPLARLQGKFLGQQSLIAANNNGYNTVDCLFVVVVHGQIHLVEVCDIQIRIRGLLDMQDHIRPVATLKGVFHTTLAGFDLAVICLYDLHARTHPLIGMANGEQIHIGFKGIQNIHGTRLILNGTGGCFFFLLTRSGKAQNKGQQTYQNASADTLFTHFAFSLL